MKKSDELEEIKSQLEEMKLQFEEKNQISAGRDEISV